MVNTELRQNLPGLVSWLEWLLAGLPESLRYLHGGKSGHQTFKAGSRFL